MAFIHPLRHASLLGLLAGLLLLTGCMPYSEVELLGVRDARVTHMDGKGLSAVVEVEVSNPNKYKITVMDPDVDLFLNGMAVGKAVMDSALVLEPLNTRTYRVPLRATFGQGGGMLPLLLGSALTGKMQIKAQGTVVGKARSLRKRFPFELEHELYFQ